MKNKEINWDDRSLEKQVFFLRQLETLGRSMRNELGFSLKLRLLEAQIDIKDKRGELIPLYPEFKDLLKDEEGINVDRVTNFINYSTRKNWLRREKKVDGYTFVMRLMTVVTPLALLEEKQKKDYRKKMMKEKENGTYDHNTYKKYKTS